MSIWSNPFRDSLGGDSFSLSIPSWGSSKTEASQPCTKFQKQQLRSKLDPKWDIQQKIHSRIKIQHFTTKSTEKHVKVHDHKPKRRSSKELIAIILNQKPNRKSQWTKQRNRHIYRNETESRSYSTRADQEITSIKQSWKTSLRSWGAMLGFNL